MPIEAFKELLPKQRRRDALSARHIFFCIEIVGVDQTRKKHPNQEFLVECCFKTPTVSEELDHGPRPWGVWGVGIKLSKQCFRRFERFESAIPDLVLGMRAIRQA